MLPTHDSCSFRPCSSTATYQLQQYMKCSLIIKCTEFPSPNPVFLQYIEKILIGTEKDIKCFEAHHTVAKVLFSLGVLLQCISVKTQ